MRLTHILSTNLFSSELLFPDSTERTYPVGREFAERCARLYSVVRVAQGGVVLISAYVAYILFCLVHKIEWLKGLYIENCLVTI